MKIQNNTYEQFLGEIKQLVKVSQNKALLQVNKELLALYWNIGKSILDKQKQEDLGG